MQKGCRGNGRGQKGHRMGSHGKEPERVKKALYVAAREKIGMFLHLSASLHVPSMPLPCCFMAFHDDDSEGPSFLALSYHWMSLASTY